MLKCSNAPSRPSGPLASYTPLVCLAGDCTSSIMYSYEADATFSGAANLRWIGHPPMVSGSVSDAEARDLAGEAFSVPWVTAIVITILGNPFAQWTLHPLHRQPLCALLRPHRSRPVPPVFRRPPGEVD